MTVKRGLRRRCDLPACGKQYRYAKASSKTCSPACRQALYLQRKQIRQEQSQAWAKARAAAMMEQTAERERQVESNRQSAPAPRPTPTPAPPASGYDYPREPDPGTRVVIIPNGRRMGRRMTPL